MATKISIRFYNGKEVRAIWDEGNSRWRFNVYDVIGAIRDVEDYDKCRNYWKWFSNKLMKEGNHLLDEVAKIKMPAPNGRLYLTNTLDSEGIIEFAAMFPNNAGAKFIQWLTYSDETLDQKSKQKAYDLFGSSLIDGIEVGTVRGLRQIHAYLFGGLYDFAGQIRRLNIAKGGFRFATVEFLDETLKSIERMPEGTLDEIVKKYVDMNVAHPFMEGNGRSMRIWLDMILKKELRKCVDWSKINKYEYLDAMRHSIVDDSMIFALIQGALTDKINDREIFMKGIDYSYYYEEPD